MTANVIFLGNCDKSLNNSCLTIASLKYLGDPLLIGIWYNTFCDVVRLRGSRIYLSGKSMWRCSLSTVWSSTLQVLGSILVNFKICQVVKFQSFKTNSSQLLDTTDIKLCWYLGFKRFFALNTLRMLDLNISCFILCSVSLTVVAVSPNGPFSTTKWSVPQSW